MVNIRIGLYTIELILENKTAETLTTLNLQKLCTLKICVYTPMVVYTYLTPLQLNNWVD